MTVAQLTRGHRVTVDAEDSDLLLHKWSALVVGKSDTNRQVYAVRCVGGRANRKTIMMHRVIAERMGLSLDGAVVDHINGDGADNRRSNLRVLSRAENAKNLTGRRSNNTSGYMGVNYEPRYRNKWVATIYVDRVKHIVGRFETAEDASAARLRAEKEMWGIQPRRFEAHGVAA